MELHIPQRAEGALGYERRDEKKRQTFTTKVSLLLFMDCQEKILKLGVQYNNYNNNTVIWTRLVVRIGSNIIYLNKYIY